MYTTKDNRFTVTSTAGNAIESVFRIVDNNCQITDYFTCPRTMELTEEEALDHHLSITGHINEAP